MVLKEFRSYEDFRIFTKTNLSLIIHSFDTSLNEKDVQLQDFVCIHIFAHSLGL